MEEKQKRFNTLTDGTADIVEKIIKKRSEGNSWFLGVDYDTVANPGKTDLGTQKIPMSRVALLTSSGLVPASMLPSSATTTLTGDMEYNSTTKHWKFTASDGKVYGCPTLATGEVAPNENTVYVDNQPAGEDYYQYMFVPAEKPTASNIGTFYCLPSPYMLIDGQATHVHDDATNFTRSINLRTAPNDVVDTNTGRPSIALKSVTDGNKTYTAIAHTRYHAGSTEAGESSSKSDLKFGDTFKVPSLSIDRSGHVSSLAERTVRIPKHSATIVNAGLCVISGETPSAIGSTSWAGDKTKYIGGVDYRVVSPADHVHTAKTLSIINGSDRATKTYKYNGSSGVTVDMDTVVGAKLPSDAPTGDSVLYYNGTSLEWKLTESITSPSAISVYNTKSIDATGWHPMMPGTRAYAPFVSLASTANVGTLKISENTPGAIEGALGGHRYMLTYTIAMINSVVAPYYLDFIVGCGLADSTHTVNASRCGIQYIHGSVISFCPTDANFGIGLFATDSTKLTVMEYGSWKADLVSLHIVELK